jgi:hypothetical protein
MGCLSNTIIVIVGNIDLMEVEGGEIYIIFLNLLFIYDIYRAHIISQEIFESTGITQKEYKHRSTSSQ